MGLAERDDQQAEQLAHVGQRKHFLRGPHQQLVQLRCRHGPNRQSGQPWFQVARNGRLGAGLALGRQRAVAAHAVAVPVEQLANGGQAAQGNSGIRVTQQALTQRRQLGQHRGGAQLGITGNLVPGLALHQVPRPALPVLAETQVKAGVTRVAQVMHGRVGGLPANLGVGELHSASLAHAAITPSRISRS
ncbi:hypothetical protein D3C81_1705080 [compost metagenome]